MSEVLQHLLSLVLCQVAVDGSELSICQSPKVLSVSFGLSENYDFFAFVFEYEVFDDRVTLLVRIYNNTNVLNAFRDLSRVSANQID